MEDRKHTVIGKSLETGKLSFHLEAAITIYRDSLKTNLAALEEVPEDCRLGHERTVEGFKQQIAEAEKFAELAEDYRNVVFFR